MLKDNVPGKQPLSPEQIKCLQALASGLQYGTITLVFQDGTLIQLERNEKIRLQKPRG